MSEPLRELGAYRGQRTFGRFRARGKFFKEGSRRTGAPLCQSLSHRYPQAWPKNIPAHALEQIKDEIVRLTMG